MKITQEITVQDRIIEEKQIKTNYDFGKSRVRFKNNRKSTRGRRIQRIVTINSQVWPPIIKTKFIKHINN